jgi:hypothetical protein
MMLTWCATAALKKSFKLFQIYSDADTIWDDDRNSCKSTCCSCIMPFHIHSLMSSDAISHSQLNVLGRNFAMSTSAADLIGTCACAHEVQFKWILAADLGFLLAMCLPSSLRDASLSQSVGTSQEVQNKFTFFLSGCLSQIEMGLLTFKFLPHSKRLI